MLSTCIFLIADQVVLPFNRHPSYDASPPSAVVTRSEFCHSAFQLLNSVLRPALEYRMTIDHNKGTFKLLVELRAGEHPSGYRLFAAVETESATPLGTIFKARLPKSTVDQAQTDNSLIQGDALGTASLWLLDRAEINQWYISYRSSLSYFKNTSLHLEGKTVDKSNCSVVVTVIPGAYQLGTDSTLFLDSKGRILGVVSGM